MPDEAFIPVALTGSNFTYVSGTHIFAPLNPLGSNQGKGSSK